MSNTYLGVFLILHNLKKPVTDSLLCIFVQAPLDRESRESYTLSVEARDGAGAQNSLSAYARVNLSVRDENDNQPSITVNAISGK